MIMVLTSAMLAVACRTVDIFNVINYRLEDGDGVIISFETLFAIEGTAKFQSPYLVQIN